MKTIQDIFTEMQEDYSAKTGLSISQSGDMAIRLYAAAAQIHALWVQAQFLEKQVFPQTAQGEYLDRHAQIRGLTRGAANCAHGLIRFTLASAGLSNTTIESGIYCRTASGVTFVTTEAGTIAAGSLYCDVEAVAVSPGASGNVPADSISVMVLAPAGVYSCTNPAAFTGGWDEETDEDLRARLLDTYSKLPNGANAAYYESRCLSIDGVEMVSVMPKERGAGTVDIIITSADGEPSEGLIDSVQEQLDAEREICVDIEVYGPDTVTVNVTAEVKPAEGYNFAAVSEAVESAIESFFTGRLLGKDVLIAKLADVIYNVEGVENYSIQSPAADVTADGDELPVLGTVTLTQMS